MASQQDKLLKIESYQQGSERVRSPEIEQTTLRGPARPGGSLRFSTTPSWTRSLLKMQKKKNFIKITSDKTTTTKVKQKFINSLLSITKPRHYIFLLLIPGTVAKRGPPQKQNCPQQSFRWNTECVETKHKQTTIVKQDGAMPVCFFLFMYFLLPVPTPTRRRASARLSRLERTSFGKAFTSERECARAWASATTAHTSGEECQQVFLFLSHFSSNIVPCFRLEASPKMASLFLSGFCSMPRL